MTINPKMYNYAPTSGDKQQAFFRALGALSAQIGAGAAPTTDISARGRAYGQAGPAFAQSYQGSLDQGRKDKIAELQGRRMQTQDQRADAADTRLGVRQEQEDTNFANQQKTFAQQQLAQQLGIKTAADERRYLEQGGYALDGTGLNMPASLRLMRLKEQLKRNTAVAANSAKTGAANTEWNRREAVKTAQKMKDADAAADEADRRAHRLKSPEQLAQDVEVARATAGVKPLTQVQTGAGNFALRMEGSEAKLKALMAGGYDPTDIVDKGASGLWRGASNYLMSEKGREYRQAQEIWVTANLRDESGAAIGEAEMDKDIRKFFPEANDTPAIIEQKAASRARAFAGMKVASGRAFKEMKDELAKLNKGKTPAAAAPPALVDSSKPPPPPGFTVTR